MLDIELKVRMYVNEKEEPGKPQLVRLYHVAITEAEDRTHGKLWLCFTGNCLRYSVQREYKIQKSEQAQFYSLIASTKMLLQLTPHQ